MQLTKRLVLASQSPRRIQLLRQIGLDVEVVPSSIAEAFDHSMAPEENAKRLAMEKALEVGASFSDAIVIGADTIVAVNGTMLGKPESSDDAAAMLATLSGRTHAVVTAFCLLDRPSNRSVTEVETTRVTFRVLPPEEIAEYVATGSPLDKAGAYGIQDDYGAVFVTRIEGCCYNVVGFPLARFYTTLRDFQAQGVS
jgi:septum formation protein